jgi:hypothetical protein
VIGDAKKGSGFPFGLAAYRNSLQRRFHIGMHLRFTHKTNVTAMKLYDKVAEESGFLVYRKAL